MRKAFQSVVSEMIDEDENLALLLGDIGVFGFNGVMSRNPNRVINVGILEQAMVSIGAGLSKSGLLPIMHTIAPFLVERALEQLKIDFGYQRLPGNLVSVGGSFDYAALGATHHCPADISILLGIPETEILIPGTSRELDLILRRHLKNDKLSYFRLSESENSVDFLSEYGKGKKIKEGTKATIVAVGPILDNVLEACMSLDVEIIYLNSIQPFDSEILYKNCNSNKVIIVEPFYAGTLNYLVSDALQRSCTINSIGIPRQFIYSYGTFSDQLRHAKLDAGSIQNQIRQAINA
jgi:transketolase